MSDDVADLAVSLSGLTSPAVEAWERAAVIGDAAAVKQHGEGCLRGCDGVNRPPPELSRAYRENLREGFRDAQGHA